ncbi:hypothetical protein B5X24_HaOG213318 [Helicoverpa armigera]|nr:hypothetical protein B5X24_HaOG213318 [Helicoverpa armigera]
MASPLPLQLADSVGYVDDLGSLELVYPDSGSDISNSQSIPKSGRLMMVIVPSHAFISNRPFNNFNSTYSKQLKNKTKIIIANTKLVCFLATVPTDGDDMLENIGAPVAGAQFPHSAYLATIDQPGRM